MTIDVALVEDSGAAHEFLKTFMGRTKPGNEAFRLSGLCGEPVTAQNSESMLQAISDHTGPLAMILDIDLYGGSNRARERATLSFQKACALVRSRMRDFSIDEADNLTRIMRRLDRGVGLPTFIVDGLEFGIAAIENQRITPLLIWIASRVDIGENLCKLMNAYARLIRGSTSTVLAFQQGPISITELTQISSLDAAETELEQLLRGLNVVLAHLTDPQARLDAWLQNPLIEHPDPEKLEAVKRAVITLLSLPEEDFERDIWPYLKKHALEMAKCSGTGRPYIGAVAAWLYALLAYLHVDGGRPWNEIFRPHELEHFDDQSGYRITPDLSSHPNDEGSLQKAVSHYFQMCRHLFRFEPDKRKPAGPLKKVTLSDDGLSFHLAFDAWHSDSKPAIDDLTSGNLIQKIARWRDAYLRNREELPQKWVNESENGPNTTARAIFDWLLTCLMNDAVHCKNGSTLVQKRFWKLTLQRPAGSAEETEVIFCD